MNNKQLYRWGDLHWDIEYIDENGNNIPLALCPRQKCHCKLSKSNEAYSIGEYKYFCVKCGFKITLNKSIEEKAGNLLDVLDSEKYRDAEIINIDGELVKIQREQFNDPNYWVDVKISKNKKNEVQLMILAGSKKEKNKTQLFLDSKNEKLSFDQNNQHPKEIFAKVIAVFKNSKSSIEFEEK